MPDTGDDGDLVGLEFHTRAAAVAESSTRKIRVEIGKSERQTRRHSLEDDNEGLAMGFTGGQITQHLFNLPAGVVPPEDSSNLRAREPCSGSRSLGQVAQRRRNVELASRAIIVPAAR